MNRTGSRICSALLVCIAGILQTSWPHNRASGSAVGALRLDCRVSEIAAPRIGFAAGTLLKLGVEAIDFRAPTPSVRSPRVFFGFAEMHVWSQAEKREIHVGLSSSHRESE